jgi:hypothetical protein
MIYIATENIENIDVARVQEHYRALSVYRKAKADKSDKNYKKYCQSVEAAYLLEKVLQEKFGIPMGTAEYETGEHGKPFIKRRSDIVFNVSHTENAVMAAFAIDEVSPDGVPCVSAKYRLWSGPKDGSLENIASSINSAVADVNNPDSYTFVIVHAWSGMDGNGNFAANGNSMQAVDELISMLDANVDVVSASEFMGRIKQYLK